MNRGNNLGISKENYLESILMIKEKNGMCKSIDISKKLKLSKASVSVAIRLLEDEKYIMRKEDGAIDLTKKGINIAKLVYDKHKFFKEILINCGVSEELAEEDACKLEHGISEESFSKLKSKLKI